MLFRSTHAADKASKGTIKAKKESVRRGPAPKDQAPPKVQERPTRSKNASETTATRHNAAEKAALEDAAKLFKPDIDDGTKRALAEFPKTRAGELSKILDGKNLDEVKAIMDAQPGVAKSVSNLNSPKGETAQVIQTKWELPDGTVVRVKETNPPGGKVDAYRREPSLSIAAVKRDVDGKPMPETYQNEAFKVSPQGVPVPKGPTDVDVAGLTPVQDKARVTAVMANGHRTLSR